MDPFQIRRELIDYYYHSDINKDTYMDDNQKEHSDKVLSFSAIGKIIDEKIRDDEYQHRQTETDADVLERLKTRATPLIDSRRPTLQALVNKVHAFAADLHHSAEDVLQEPYLSAFRKELTIYCIADGHADHDYIKSQIGLDVDMDPLPPADYHSKAYGIKKIRLSDFYGDVRVYPFDMPDDEKQIFLDMVKRNIITPYRLLFFTDTGHYWFRKNEWFRYDCDAVEWIPCSNPLKSDD